MNGERKSSQATGSIHAGAPGPSVAAEVLQRAADALARNAAAVHRRGARGDAVVVPGQPDAAEHAVLVAGTAALVRSGLAGATRASMTFLRLRS